MVASTQIGTMLDPCTYLSESDSNFEFCEKKTSLIFVKHIDQQSQKVCVDKNKIKILSKFRKECNI